MPRNPPNKRVALSRAAWREAPCKYPHFSKNILTPLRNETLDTPLDVVHASSLNVVQIIIVT